LRDVGLNLPNLEDLKIARGIILEGPTWPGPEYEVGDWSPPPPPLPPAPAPLPRLRVLRVSTLYSRDEDDDDADVRGDLHRIAPNLEEIYVESITSGFCPGPALRGLRRLRLLEFGDESSVEGAPTWMRASQFAGADEPHLRLPLGRDGAIECVPAGPDDEAAAPAAEDDDAAAGAGGLELHLKWDIDGDVWRRGRV
jgi:hypothetical protein